MPPTIVTHGTAKQTGRSSYLRELQSTMAGVAGFHIDMIAIRLDCLSNARACALLWRLRKRLLAMIASGSTLIALPGRQFYARQDKRRSMHEEVEDIDRPRELTGGEHLQLFPDMRFRREGCDAERQARQRHDTPWQAVDKVYEFMQ